METGERRGFDVGLTEPGILTITFTAAERLNALTRAAKRDLIEVLLAAQMDHAVRIVVFTGCGRAFVAGDDLDRSRQESDHPTLVPALPYGDPAPITTYSSLRTTSQQLNRTVRDLDKITIAAINGFAIQSGMSLALACDFRIASTAARLGSGTLRYGFLPDEGGHYFLLQHLGLSGTLDALLRNKIFDADEALAKGLVNDVVLPDELLPRAMALATELANGPQVAMRLLKRSVYQAWELTMEQAMDDIASKTAVSDHHPDAVEGRRAFREKRRPRYNAWLGPTE